MNVRKILVMFIVMITLIAQIRMDRISVLAKMDILEMVHHVMVSVCFDLFLLLLICLIYIAVFLAACFLSISHFPCLFHN